MRVSLCAAGGFADAFAGLEGERVPSFSLIQKGRTSKGERT
jgi:hypothetical protein